jgi:predicted dehydrogenase
MALDMTPEQREVGKANFQRVADGLTRRGFLKSLAVTGSVVVPVSAAAYFQYSRDKVPGKPVKAGLIGAGDEGGVLIGEHNPAYLEVVAVSDIRPTNQERIFEGELKKNPTSPRKGLNYHYGRNASKSIKVYERYQDLLARQDIEAVIIALPLVLHAPVAIAALEAGKHVLCEKLMAWNITQCKKMIAVAHQHDRVLSIGHQRHYSLLYAHALEVLQSGILGDVRYIRALWHRNNTWPKLDAKGKEIPGEFKDSWKPDIPAEDAQDLADRVRQFGFKNMEELVRWRLFDRTGAGLMAELGSHQLDACSIFLGKVHPLAVSGFGGKLFYRDEREIDDHVFVTFEFPGKNHPKYPGGSGKDQDDKVVVTYSSINTNSFEPYGECVMGTRGTMLVQQEQEIMLYPERGGRAMTVTVSTTGAPALDTTGSGPPTPGGVAAPASSGPISRGYREEIEHFAYCIRMWGQGMSQQDRPLPRCHGKAAMADAIIAMTANEAMRTHQRKEFKDEWFDPASPEVPDPERKAEVITG